MVRRVASPGANWLSTLVRLAASPVFFALAAVNFAGGEGMNAFMIINCRNPIRDALSEIGADVPEGVFAALGSMWLMYLLMGAFHLGAWLDAVAAVNRPKHGRNAH